MTLTWPPGTAAAFLAEWDTHAVSFIPQLVERPDFTQWLDTFERRMTDAGEDEFTARRLVARLREAQEQMAGPLSQRLIDWLGLACDRDLAQTFDTQDILLPVEGQPIKWPTGMVRVDALTGGGYGLTVYGGQPKMGKSIAALGAALRACEAGWTVLVVNAELTEREMHQRAMRYITRHKIDPGVVAIGFAVFNAHPGFMQSELLAELEHTVSMDTDRILIVLDSINRLAQNDHRRKPDEAGYFATLRDWCEWPRIATRLSDGRISFLVVSELNRKDQIKGADLEYASNLAVRFTGVDDQPGLVSVDVSLSRETPAGDCGIHRRVWESASFVPNDEGEQF